MRAQNRNQNDSFRNANTLAVLEGKSRVEPKWLPEISSIYVYQACWSRCYVKPPLLEKESHLLPMKYPIMGLFLPPGFVPKKLLQCIMHCWRNILSIGIWPQKCWYRRDGPQKRKWALIFLTCILLHKKPLKKAFVSQIFV